MADGNDDASERRSRMLDEISGAVPGPNDHDPTHVRALATRVGNLDKSVHHLTELVHRVEEGGNKRDETLAELKTAVGIVKEDVSKIEAEMKALAVIPPGDLDTFNKVMSDAKFWANARNKLGSGTLKFIGVAVAVWALHDPLGRMFASIGAFFGGGSAK